MQKLFSLFIFFLISGITFSQTAPPQAFNYSGVARDAANNALSNQNIAVQFSILKGSTTGVILYAENHATSTDSFGVFNLKIGMGAVQSGVFATIDWSLDSYYLQVGLDASGGANFQLMGTTQFLSVPYALHAKTADMISSGGGTGGSGKTYVVITGDITDAQAALKIQQEVGSNTQFVWIIKTTQLTSLDVTGLTEAVEVNVQQNSQLSMLSFPDLAVVFNEVNVSQNYELLNLNFPSLISTENLFILSYNPKLNNINLNTLSTSTGTISFYKNNLLNSVSLPALTKCGTIIFDSNCPSVTLPVLQEGSVYISGNITTSLSVPSMTKGGFNIYANSLSSFSAPLLNEALYTSIGSAALTSLSFPSLTNITDDWSCGGNSLNSVTFPVLSSIGTNSSHDFIINSSNIVNFSLPSLAMFEARFNFIQNKFSQSTLDGIIDQIYNISPPITGKYIDISSQWGGGVPSIQAQIKIQTMIANGNTIIF